MLGGKRSAFQGDLLVAASEFAAARLIESDAVFDAVHFQRGVIQHVLVLADFRVERVDALAQAILLGFLFVDHLGVLRFGGGEFRQAGLQAVSLGIQFAGFACQHLAHNGAHLLANFGVAARFGGLALQGAELLFDFDDDVVYAGQIHLGRFEFCFAEALFGFEFCYAGGFFDDGAALHRLGGEDLADAALFDDGVGVRPQADAHEHFLNVAQAADAAVDQVFALAAAIEAAADNHFTGLGDQRGLL